GLDEREPLRFLQKLDAVTGGVAPEAVVKDAIFVDVKARCLFLVERTQADVASPAARELYRFTHELDEVRLLPDAVDRVLTDHRRFSTAYSPLARERLQVAGMFPFPVRWPAARSDGVLARARARAKRWQAMPSVLDAGATSVVAGATTPFRTSFQQVRLSTWCRPQRWAALAHRITAR